MTKRGRPPMEEADKKKWTNVNIERDILEELKAAAKQMEAEFGFKPTVNQALRRLIKMRQSND